MCVVDRVECVESEAKRFQQCRLVVVEATEVGVRKSSQGGS